MFLTVQEHPLIGQMLYSAVSEENPQIPVGEVMYDRW